MLEFLLSSCFDLTRLIFLEMVSMAITSTTAVVTCFDFYDQNDLAARTAAGAMTTTTRRRRRLRVHACWPAVAGRGDRAAVAGRSGGARGDFRFFYFWVFLVPCGLPCSPINPTAQENDYSVRLGCPHTKILIFPDVLE